MPNSVDMLKSLGFYVNCKKVGGALKTACQSVHDYHDFLADIEESARSSAGIAGFSDAHPLLPLVDITLTQLQYSDIVDQIYDGGIHFMSLSLPYPPPTQIVPPARPSYFRKYLQVLGNDARTERDVGSILLRTNEILRDREATRQRVNGLVVGRVQSGKTRNYIGLMLKAVDEGWNVIVILTSANTALADQTQTRIEKDFTRAEAYDGHMVNFRGRTVPSSPTALLSPASTSFFWGVAMKEKHNLDTILNWFTANEHIAGSMRVLVIDDEADNATPDSNAGRPQNLTDGEIEDLVAAIRDEDDADWDFSDLAEWVDGLQSSIEGKFKEAERDPGSKVDCNIHDIRSFLDSPGKVEDKRNAVLANNRFLTLLDLQPHPSDEDGHPMDVAEDIRHYFIKARGRGFRTMGIFVKLLKTVFDVAEDRSAISSRICKLIDRPKDSESYTFDFQRCAYFAYTATPYACILNERPDETPLYADFIYSLELSSQYFGLDKIFGTDLKTPEPNMRIIDEIGAEDERFVLKPIQKIKDRGISPPEILNVSPPDGDLCYTCQNPSYSGSWDSMKRALAWAFCAAGVRRWFCREVYEPGIEARTDLTDDEKDAKLDELDYRWTTMLVNVSQKQDSHEDQKAAILRYLNARCATAVSRDAFLDQCRATWDDLTGTFTKSMFDSLFNASGDEDDYGQIRDYPDWSDMREDVRFFLENVSTRVHAIVINSANERNRDQQDYYNQVGAHKGELQGEHLWIVCGGNTISRGLTLTGLTTSYFDRVRKSVAVDTLTQMGRWFGYRKDYELLPRIWMTAPTVMELKKTAIVESRMHESIRENFDAGYSPCDPAHYQQIYCWGRKLSGRARAQSAVVQAVGATSTTDDIWTTSNKMDAVYDLAKNFVASLGPQAIRPASDYRLYNTFPLWTKIDKSVIRAYLSALAEEYPDRSKLALKSLVREIDHTESGDPDELLWDVVIGEPASHRGNSYAIGVDRDIASGCPAHVDLKDGVAHYTSVRSDTAFYAMIRTNDMILAEEEMLRLNLEDVVGVIERKQAAHGGILPTQFETALAGYHGTSLSQRVTALLDAVHDDPQNVAIPPCIRDCMPEGFRNRSAADYRERVHAFADHPRPTLQIYLLTPPAGAEVTASPMIAHAFYWPSHVPDEFHVVAAGLPPHDRAPKPDLADFCNAVAAVLAENGFPMTPGGGLRERVIARLENCDADFFNQNIARNLAGAPYAKVPESDAYYHTAWATDPIAKLRAFVVERALDILGDHQPHEERDIATQVMAENTRLENVFSLVRARPGGHAHITEKWKSAMTDGVIAAKGIEIVSRRPVTYRLP